jgi:hypothetical protein
VPQRGGAEIRGSTGASVTFRSIDRRHLAQSGIGDKPVAALPCGRSRRA